MRPIIAANAWTWRNSSVELALVLCSLAVLTKGPRFWYAGIAAGVLGALIGLTSVML